MLLTVTSKEKTSFPGTRADSLQPMESTTRWLFPEATKALGEKSSSWSKFIMEDGSLWRGPMLEQERSLGRKERKMNY